MHTQDKTKLFGRRKGRSLSPTLQAHLDQGLEHFSLLDQGPFTTAGQVFSHPYDAHVLEIGFGGGEHLVAQAAAHPTVGFIGAEPFVNGVASLCRQLNERGLQNVRIYPDNVFDLVRNLPSQFFRRIYILFPDPWPKKRHQDRRLISASSLTTLATSLEDAGELIIATDHAVYYDWIVEAVEATRSLYDWVNRDTPEVPLAGWVKTRYQQKADVQGRLSRFICLRKRPR